MDRGSTELPGIFIALLKEAKKEAIRYKNPEMISKADEIISCCRRGDLETAREIADEISPEDLRIEFFLVIAGISKEESDIEIVRRGIEQSIEQFGEVQPGVSILLAHISRQTCDYETARREIKKDKSLFGRVYCFLALFSVTEQKEDLQSARKSAQVDDLFLKTASLMLINNVTGRYEDSLELYRAIGEVRKTVDERDLEIQIPHYIDIDSILKITDFQEIIDITSEIKNDNIRAKVLTLVMLKRLRK